jgi:hypothetical protein
MRLIRTLLVLLAVSGCSESLFGARVDRGNGPPDGGDDTSIPDTCPASCIADAAASYNGTVGGADGRWRYLGDQRDHTWAPMIPMARVMVGEANNRIEPCADKPAAACTGLPGALLVTSSGTSSMSDPAIEYTAPDARVIQLALHVYVPGDSVEHRVRLYRNSREDVLFTTSAAPGATVAHAITVDALPGDRFLVALEPSGGQGGTAALHLFVIDAHLTFPSTCQLAVTFSDPTIVGSTIDDLCGGKLTSIDYTTQPAPPQLANGPFAYQGMSVSVHLEPGFYLYGSQPLEKAATTVQFWVQNEAPTDTKAWVFSDLNKVNAGGLGIQFTNTPRTLSGLRLEAAVVSTTSPVMYTSQSIGVANPQDWHFVRVVHTGGMVTFCLDGARVMSFPLAGPTAPGSIATLGRNGITDTVDQFSGSLDDVRVFSDALPCNE